ncbi:uncharacterized protein LOC121736761, partial [Aricia agestis]|uniref:uncharacterized protein LOC121736761 n=1 Tax=Aricia agestis TaxID=91739 RepID=UPI001C209007
FVAEINANEHVEASRIKREGISENRDLTVLLVNDQNRNDYNTKIGRYHSVKPLIGLLTSTARTFIQDGVTTEFATQILGTTLDNGRIYAQLLTKSSLVLYNKPSNVDDDLVQPTRVHSAFDGKWNLKQDLGIVDPDKFVLKNTDYLAPSSKMDIIYASKPATDSYKAWNAPPVTYENTPDDNQIFEEPEARKAQIVKEEPKFEVYNYLDGPNIEGEKNIELVRPAFLNTIESLHRQSKAYDTVTEPVKESVENDADTINESSVVKVKPDYDLPTFTIKNEFSPIFYYIDNVESRYSPQQPLPQTKLPKKLFGQSSEPKSKTTFTYAGFADFTTVVGDTVIIFSPNTETVRQPNPDEVNVFSVSKPAENFATKITFLSADIPVATATYNADEIVSTRVAISTSSSSSSENSSERNLYNDEESLKKVMYNVDDKMPDTVQVKYNNGFDLNIDVIQPSEPAYTFSESSKNTEDISTVQIQDFSSRATEPLENISPSSTITTTPKESVVTESNLDNSFTNPAEESENTAAEVIENNEEDEEQEENEDKRTTLGDQEVKTTTESGHSDESYEIETTTENKLNKHKEVFCTDGIETLSTMTTAYKTLTYLTTYFIPLESTETTTSIKSDVVVESNVGYLTNVVCKTNIDIEPTSVLSKEYQNTDISHIESPETIQETDNNLSTPSLESESNTENIGKLTVQVQEQEKGEEEITTHEDVTTEKMQIENEPPVQTSTSKTTTTTEKAVTTHVEISVTTEHTPVDDNKPKEDEINDSENEIDLIYKTLYTTYTYFTTFFGDQTSSVASHKSIITNIITSTVDLSNFDPSLFDSYNDDEIAPTSVITEKSTETNAINSIIDLVKNKDVIESVEGDQSYSSQTPTPVLGEDVIASIKPDGVKTYFTTYTFFTTIYVGSDANVCSRSEVYTNFVGPNELVPSKTNQISAENTRAQFDFRNCKQVKGLTAQNSEENSSVESSVSSEQDNIKELKEKDPSKPKPIEVDMLFSVESNPILNENSFVTDIKSSSSKGETKYLDNNNVLDDQISSESNIEEILPSPTLLLQTSYTTFTYFTTMYIGKDSSKVKSRLETITNVVTETISPKSEPEEVNNLPITYYTTFTYWTTLYKDKSTTITSREEIVSNVVTPTPQSIPTISPIDTTPIDVVSDLPQKELLDPIKPSMIQDNLETDDGKATFYTTYTYFTTFYVGNTSQVRSSLETETNIVENTKVLEDNQIGRKVPTGGIDKNLIQDIGDKPIVTPTKVKEQIEATLLPNVSAPASTILQGTYIDNLFAEVKPVANNASETTTEKKILFSQVAVISGDSTIVTNDNTTLPVDTSSTTTTTESPQILTPTPDVIESSVAEPETTTEYKVESGEEEDDDSNTRKKGRLTFTTKKPSFTPVIIPFASRNRPTFSPKRQSIPSSATTITRADFTPTITATPTLKAVRASSGFGGSRKQSAVPSSSSPGRKFAGRGSSTINLNANVPSSRPGSFSRGGSIQPTSRRTGFRSSSLRSNSLDLASRSASARVIRPTASSRLRNGRQSSSFSNQPAEQNEFETYATQQDDGVTDSLDEVTENPRTTNNPLLKFRRPPVARQPGTAIIPRATTSAPKRSATPRGRATTTTTRRTTTRTTPNPLLSLRRQRPNALFPKRNLFKQPEPEPEEEIRQEEQNVSESEELLEEEEEFDDNDYDASNRKEQQVATPSTPQFRRTANIVQIRPFAFKRRTKRQVDYGNRKFTNFRRPALKSVSTRKPEPEPETEPPAQTALKPKSGRRISSGNRSPSTSAAPKSSARQPYIVRGESRTTTTSAPAYRRGNSRPSSRTTTHSSRPKAPRLSHKSTPSSRSGSSRSSTGRSRSRTTTSRQRSSFENLSGERFNKYDTILNDGKITVTHQIPFEVTVPVVNGKVTEYKNLLTAKPKVETLLLNQISTSIGILGNQQLVLAVESTGLGDNGATKITKYVLHETPTTTVIFTPTTIRGRKTSYSHILPSTIYNVEPVVQTIAPEINSNVPLANLLLSQLLLGNQQPGINPLLALQGQALLPQQPVVQTPVTEYKTKTTTYVTTVTDARETVLPITFRGTPILTTIVDPTIEVITATEYFTETVVTTPTVLAPPPQYNSLLLQQILLQQQQQQQQALSLQTANPLLGLAQPNFNLGQNNLLPNQNNFLSNDNLINDIYSNSPKPNILSDLNSNEEDFSEDIPIPESEEDVPPPPPPPPTPQPTSPPTHTRKRHKHKAQSPAAHPTPPAPKKLTSVVTLYVSGKHPGEFSTVLSTVVSDDTQTVRKREAIYYEDAKILPSILPTIDQLSSSQDDSLLENSIYTNLDKYIESSYSDSQVETQSLESIVGKISDHVNYDASPTYVVKFQTPSMTRDQKQTFNTNGIVFDNSPWRPGRDIDVSQDNAEDERKLKNLATRIMSNGVEVLVKDKGSNDRTEQTKYMDLKTVQPTQMSNMFSSQIHKINKRIDSDDEDGFELIQPSEINHVPCTTRSCSCSHTKTENLKTKYTNINDYNSNSQKYTMKTTRFSDFKIKSTIKEPVDKKTQYRPYEYESTSQIAPTDKIVEKYTEVISDYSDEKDTSSIEANDLLTNEQAPSMNQPNKTASHKNPIKHKNEKPQKVDTNKLVVAELIKLGSLGIKGLSQLAPVVIEKMTGGFMKRHDNINKTVVSTTSTTTVKPILTIHSYNANKRIDSMETKQGSFPMYIPVDDMETAESQVAFTNATLHQNMAWAAEFKNSKPHILLKSVHESPLVNGGIPISPGDIITANSDVIVGKPAVGGPLTLGASGLKIHNHVSSPPVDNYVSGNEHYVIRENRPQSDQIIDDSFDLRPPELSKPSKNIPRPLNQHSAMTHAKQPNKPNLSKPPSNEFNKHMSNKNIPVPLNHGRPAFLDYIPSLKRPNGNNNMFGQSSYQVTETDKNKEDIADNSPSSSEIVSSKIIADGEYSILDPDDSITKPFLVDIQPSKVANVLIPHGSTTALVFAGSSEPHKTGNYVDAPLPYPEPGYFGSFSIDAPQMTNVHNVSPNKNQFYERPDEKYLSGSYKINDSPTDKENFFINDHKVKNENKRPKDYSKVPPPTSIQESHIRVGPQITVYNPDDFKNDPDKFNRIKNNNKSNELKEVIDKEYENYLAVPPPPPKLNYNQGSYQEKSNFHHQRPTVHTKPIHDTKIHLNIQHPIPNQLPPKVTSEVYFASQMPSSEPTSSYTISFPPQSHSVKNHFQTPAIDNHDKYVSINQQKPNTQKTLTKTPGNNVHKPIKITPESGNTFAHTLSTATTVPISTSQQNGQVNADIPIGTNFAIKVEDDPAKYESVALHGKISPTISSQDSYSPYNLYNDMKNKLSNNRNAYNITNTLVRETHSPSSTQQPQGATFDFGNTLSSINSHANFPMMNDHQESIYTHKQSPHVQKDVKGSSTVNNKFLPDNQPQNTQTNSHGWYLSILNEKNVKKINVETSTRVMIPLNYDTNRDNLPEFGNKLAAAGKPPSDLWDQKTKHPINNFNIGKPFSKVNENKISNGSASSQYQHVQYIPSIPDDKQITYNIPIRHVVQPSTVTTRPPPQVQSVKVIYENADEVYDGDDSSEAIGDADGEVSSESVKVPIVASSNNTIEIHNFHANSDNNASLAKPVQNSIKDTQPNSETQTEKPFGLYTKPAYHSNNIQTVFNNDQYNKPRPFTINTAMTLDHQLQQPHWQINQLMVNSTNVSYEDNMDLNIGEEISAKPASTTSSNNIEKNLSNKYKLSSNVNNGINNASIITSTVHIHDKKPIIVKVSEKTTLPTFTISTHLDRNNSKTDIIDLSPPPPTSNNNLKTSTDAEQIMGMSPPPPKFHLPNRHSQRKPPPKPVLPIRTPPPYLALPPKSLPPRLPTQKTSKKPNTQEEISTYRPTYDITNKAKRPLGNRDQPSSQLLPPPIHPPTIIVKETSKSTQIPNSVIFPTPLSSGWLTSSGVEFSSGINFAPTSVQFPEIVLPSKTIDDAGTKVQDYSSENSYSYEYETSAETDNSSEKNHESVSVSQESSSAKPRPRPVYKPYSSTESYEDSKEYESKNTTTTSNLGNRNRTRRPYPIRNNDKKSTTPKYKLSTKPFSAIKPTRTLTRPEILYPTRTAPVNKVVRPLPSQPSPVQNTYVIESSESSPDEYYVKPTDHFNEPTITPEITSIIEKTITSTLTVSKEILPSNSHQTHHAGNEIKISDDIIPTKTEFKTTVITHTKTLSEPPETVSSIGYVNLTHTLTVTHTKTSLVSQSEGAITETLVLTNTETSTIVDVVTEIYTQVLPTTIIETVTKHIPVQVEPTSVQNIPSTKIALDDISMSSEERENYIIKDNDVTENIQKIQDAEEEKENDTFFVVMNKSQNGGKLPSINTDIDTGDYEGITRNEQVNNNGVSQVLFGEILLAGAPYLETTNVGHTTGYSKECQPDCKASRNERCQRIDGIMKCVCRPGFARMFPDRPCKPTYTYSVSLALGSRGNERLRFDEKLSDNSSKEYHDLAVSSYEGINRMIMQSDLRDVYHGVHITKFHPVAITSPKGDYEGVVNDFYVQLSDNAHESRLKEVIEKYLRHNNFSLGGTPIHAAETLLDRLNVSDFDECTSRQFHDCSEHARCFNLRGTYTCSCLEGFADLSVNTMYPGRICSSEAVGCAGCNYHGTCFERENMMICECFKWYSGRTCQVNLKAVLITVTSIGAIVIIVVTIYASKRCCCQKGPATQTFVIGCMQGMPSLHQGNIPKQRADRRALIAERAEVAETCSVQNTSLPYIPSKQHRSRSSSKKLSCMGAPPAHAPPPPPAPAVLIPRARLHHDSRDNLSRKKSLEACNEAKLISYLESGANNSINDEMRRKHSMESSYSVNKEKPNKQGALVSAGFKVSTTVRPDESALKDDRDDASSINKTDLEAELSRFDTLRKTYSQEDMSEWTDAERRIGELTLSEARSIGGTLPASTGRAASSTRLTHQENTMAERDLGSTFLLPHVHLYKPDLTSDVSEFDSL